MDERRRRSYLSVMGVTVWELRVPAIATSPQVEAEEVAPEPCSEAVELASTTSFGMPGAVTEEAAPTETSRAPRASDAEAATVVERMDWDVLEAEVAGCRACGLCETRTQTVFGVGSRAAELMIIGEAPGADEDRAGEPFVGRAGQLLNRMLAAIGFAREQVYIANVLKCRPPGNRDPKPEESLRCQAYLLRQIALIRPRLILSVGRISAQQLLKTDMAVGRLRGRWFEDGPGGIALRVTYHPAYLLRSPEQKAKAWEDLTEVRRRLDGPGAALEHTERDD